jgi:uncharacterized membrane protein
MTLSKAKKSVNSLLKQQGSNKSLGIFTLILGLLWMISALTNDNDGWGSAGFWQACVWILIGVSYLVRYSTVKTFDAYISELQSNANETKP